MNSRQADILAAVVREYTKAAIPVGSKAIAEKYNLDVSPATVRHDLNVLEEAGYIYQPHVSAGRIPTDKGYRYFVDEFLGDAPLSPAEQKKLQREFLQLKAKYHRMGRTTAKLLSALSGNLAVTGIMDRNEFYDFGIHELLSQPDFQDLDEVCRVAEMLDYLDESVDDIFKKLDREETQIFIGRENPIRQIRQCSMIASSFKNKKGEKGLIAIIGPKRMEYRKNKSLVDFVRRLLSSSTVLMIASGSGWVIIS